MEPEIRPVGQERTRGARVHSARTGELWSWQRRVTCAVPPFLRHEQSNTNDEKRATGAEQPNHQAAGENERKDHRHESEEKHPEPRLHARYLVLRVREGSWSLEHCSRARLFCR